MNSIDNRPEKDEERGLRIEDRQWNKSSHLDPRSSILDSQNSPPLEDPRVVRAVEEYLAALETGSKPDRQEFLSRYPEVAPVLAACLESLEFVQAAAPQLHDAAAEPGLPTHHSPLTTHQAGSLNPEGPLGDFRLIRQIGRGGMGVVYEAIQISLGRRVALKILPFASTLDAKQLQRFKNEAQAAAGLHHTNIVPVYATGAERGVHYYAMQYIEGQTVAALIRELRLEAGLEDRGSKIEDELASRVALAPGSRIEDRGSKRKGSEFDPAPTGPFTPEAEFPGNLENRGSGMKEGVATVADRGAGNETVPAKLRSSILNPQSSFFRTVAELGIQAAEALEYAHQMGIIHRDIKPGNLLIETSSLTTDHSPPTTHHSAPRVWITDFGLAHCQGAVELTMSGDLLGTLRYMSPEQALAQRVLVDQRTDIYSLGVTLYELLTLQPIFPGADRKELLRQIAFEEPKRPRQLSRAVPLEMETIVLKAMEKNPVERYATAQELANDLRRFLENKPIQARRPTLLSRARKWGRRNRAAVGTAAVCLLLALAGITGSISWIVGDRAARWALAKEKVQLALADAAELQRRARWPEALEAVKRAEAILAGGGHADLRDHVRELRKDLEMVLRLEEIRLPRAVGGSEGAYDNAWADASYAKAFQEYDIDVETHEPAEAAERIRARTIRLELTVALDDWAHKRKYARKGDPSWKRLIAVALAADPDEWRTLVRRELEMGQIQSLNRLAASEKVKDLPLQTMSLLASCVEAEASETVLRQAQRRYPDDYWINFKLAWSLDFRPKSQLDEAIRFYTAALAARPRNVPAYCWLGLALQHRGRVDEAIAVCRRAVELDSEYKFANDCLASALQEGRKFEEALGVYRKTFELQPNSGLACNNLAWLLATCPVPKLRDVDRALQLAKKAVDLAPKEGVIWNTLGVAHYRAGHWQESKAALEKAMQLFGGHYESFNTFFLAMTHWQLGQPEAARKWHQQAVAWMEKNMPHDAELGRFRAEAEELLKIDPKDTKKKPSN